MQSQGYKWENKNVSEKKHKKLAKHEGDKVYVVWGYSVNYSKYICYYAKILFEDNMYYVAYRHKYYTKYVGNPVNTPYVCNEYLGGGWFREHIKMPIPGDYKQLDELSKEEFIKYISKNAVRPENLEFPPRLICQTEEEVRKYSDYIKAVWHYDDISAYSYFHFIPEKESARRKRVEELIDKAKVIVNEAKEKVKDLSINESYINDMEGKLHNLLVEAASLEMDHLTCHNCREKYWYDQDEVVSKHICCPKCGAFKWYNGPRTMPLYGEHAGETGW